MNYKEIAINLNSMENRGLLSFTTPLFLNGNMSNQKLCRTCLSEHENTTSLFQDEIDKMLLYCTSIQVSIIQFFDLASFLNCR